MMVPRASRAGPRTPQASCTQNRSIRLLPHPSQLDLRHHGCNLVMHDDCHADRDSLLGGECRYPQQLVSQAADELFKSRSCDLRLDRGAGLADTSLSGSSSAVSAAVNVDSLTIPLVTEMATDQGTAGAAALPSPFATTMAHTHIMVSTMM